MIETKSCNAIRAWRAGRVRRWHSNADMADTVETVDGHQARVARLVLALSPLASRNLLRAALTHDDGEHASGDVSGPIKRQHPALADELRHIEDVARQSIWGSDATLTAHEQLLLDVCDKLDAYLWVRHHRPEHLSGHGWPEARQRLQADAIALGLTAEIGRLLG